MPAAEFVGANLDRGFSFDLAIDLANHTAMSSVDTVVTVPAGILLDPGDRVLAIPPAALNAGIVPQTARYTSATTFTLRTTNPTAGAIDPASQTWTFLVLRN
jgi:hypothetical protein